MSMPIKAPCCKYLISHRRLVYAAAAEAEAKAVDKGGRQGEGQDRAPQLPQGQAGASWCRTQGQVGRVSVALTHQLPSPSHPIQKPTTIQHVQHVLSYASRADQHSSLLTPIVYNVCSCLHALFPGNRRPPTQLYIKRVCCVAILLIRPLRSLIVPHTHVVPAASQLTHAVDCLHPSPVRFLCTAARCLPIIVFLAMSSITALAIAALSSYGCELGQPKSCSGFASRWSTPKSAYTQGKRSAR